MNETARETPTLPDCLRQPIEDRASAEQWIRNLHRHDLMFHFEDDPADIYCLATGLNTFREDDLTTIRTAVEALYAQDWGEHECPIGFALTLKGMTA